LPPKREITVSRLTRAVPKDALTALSSRLSVGTPWSEEEAVTKDGIRTYWLVKTSPIKNEKGEVIAAMEMSLDVTHIRFLEKEVERSEEKYRTVFNTIPHPVFVLDSDNLTILDCNDRVKALYGFEKGTVEEVLSDAL
jgi:histidine kinase